MNFSCQPDHIIVGLLLLLERDSSNPTTMVRSFCFSTKKRRMSDKIDQSVLDPHKVWAIGGPNGGQSKILLHLKIYNKYIYLEISSPLPTINAILGSPAARYQPKSAIMQAAACCLFHGFFMETASRYLKLLKNEKEMVGAAGIEPATPPV